MTFSFSSFGSAELLLCIGVAFFAFFLPVSILVLYKKKKRLKKEIAAVAKEKEATSKGWFA